MPGREAFLVALLCISSVVCKNALSYSSETLTLLKGGIVYSPEPLGQHDILMSGGGGGSDEQKDTGGRGSILAILTPAESARLLEVSHVFAPMLRVIPVPGMIIIPGFVDMHEHLTGGGGEIGPISRTPPGSITAIIEAGITTAVGVLGTDGVTRSPADLLARVKALRAQGLSSYMMSGAYRTDPLPTLTGDVQRDLIYVEEVIGIGEIAIADHRSSQSSTQTLATYAAAARVGGLLGAKGGITHFHVGPSTKYISQIFDLLSTTDLPAKNIHPTHMERSPELVAEGVKLLRLGGGMDFTAEPDKDETVLILKSLVQWSPPVTLERVTVSSDAFGSLPMFDDHGHLIRYGVGQPSTLMDVFRGCVRRGFTVDDALQFFTTNPARVLGLANKGEIALGKDADIVVLNPTYMNVSYVVTNGKIMKTPTWVYRDMFDDT